MKKKRLSIVVILILIAMLFLLTGCENNSEVGENEQVKNQISQEENTKKNVNSEIVGKWLATGTDNNVYSLGELYGSAFSYTNELTIKEDGTYVLGIGVTYWQEGNYEIDGDKIKLTNTQIKGDNPDGKTAEQFIIKNENGKKQIILEEKTQGIIINVLFENSENISNSENNVTDISNNKINKIEAGNYSLEYGNYKNVTLSNGVPQGGTYTIKEDGTFSCTNSEGTATGTYTVKEETYDNSGEMNTDWLITFKSSNKNIINANTSWLIDGNNQFSGVQSGGTFKYMGK